MGFSEPRRAGPGATASQLLSGGLLWSEGRRQPLGPPSVVGLKGSRRACSLDRGPAGPTRAWGLSSVWFVSNISLDVAVLFYYLVYFTLFNFLIVTGRTHEKEHNPPGPAPEVPIRVHVRARAPC